MESSNITGVHNIVNNQKDNNSIYLNKPVIEGNEPNKVFRRFAAENCEDFYTYVDWLGLAKDPDLIILSSTHHYYYDKDDLKNVKTIIHLKQLNQTKQLKGLLHTVFHLLPPGSSFIGCFVDNNKKQQAGIKKSEESFYYSGQFDPFDNGVASRNPFFNMIYNILDSKTNRFLTKRSVRLLLEEHGLKVTDMTEYNGTTYFSTQKIHHFAE
jgi:hypothetical protein